MIRTQSTPNRFVPAVSGAKRDWRLVVFPTVGELRVRNSVLPAGSVLVAPQTILSSAEPTHWIASRGQSVSLSAVRILPESLVEARANDVAVVSISEATCLAFRSLVEPTDAGDTARALRLGQALFDALVRDGVARTSLREADEQERRTLAVRTVEAVFPLLSSLGTEPMVVDIVASAGVGERQVLRNIQQVPSEFDLPDRGWRETIVRWRVTAAVLLLSSDILTLTEVAGLSGYSGSKTIGAGALRSGPSSGPRDPPTASRSALARAPFRVPCRNTAGGHAA